MAAAATVYAWAGAGAATVGRWAGTAVSMTTWFRLTTLIYLLQMAIPWYNAVALI